MTDQTGESAPDPFEALRAALDFLTPFGGGRSRPTPEVLSFFPLVGAGIGAAVGGGADMVRRRRGSLLGAAVGVVGDLVVTGALHLDGLADSADGLLAHVPTRSRLDIMSESTVGAFGAAAITAALVARFAGFADGAPGPTMCAALWCASRSVMVLAIGSLPYARAEGGLASALAPEERVDLSASRRAGVAGIASAVFLGWRARGLRGVVAVLGGCAGAIGVLALARHRLGGYTGDVLGAAGVVCETVGLALVATR